MKKGAGPWLLLYIGLSSGENPPKPEYSYGEFPFYLEYEINGQIMSVEDTVIVKYDGIGLSEGTGKDIKWKQTLASGNEEVVLFQDGDSVKIIHPVRERDYHLEEKIVQKVFHQPLAMVIEEKILKPYGFTETGWRKENSENLVWLDETYVGEQGGEANLFVSTRELAFWGYLHLTKGYYQGKQILPKPIFEQAVTIITPSALDDTLPRNGFFWWVQDKPRATSELGGQLPKGTYQSLGIYGNALLVIPVLTHSQDFTKKARRTK